MTDENEKPKSALDLDKPLLDQPVPLDPELVAAVRRQVMEELKSDEERARQDKIIAREDAKKAQEEYVAKMKESSDPWVDIQGWVQTDQGIRVELDWNDAFVDHLKTEGVTGADDDQVVQRWVTLLLRDMTTKLEEENPEKSEYS